MILLQDFPMRVVIDSDCNGHELKKILVQSLRESGHEVVDLDFSKANPDSNYPDVALNLGRKIQKGEFPKGVLICGTGLGMAITANKLKGVYAGACEGIYAAERLAKYITQSHIVQEITSFKDGYFRENVEESVAHAWYEGDWQKHPFDEPMPEPKYDDFNADGNYSWVKAPRFQGKPMQVGPLAQVLVGYAQGNPAIKKYVDDTLSLAGSIAGVKLSPAVLHSTLGRHAARAIRAAYLSDLALKHWGLLAENIGKGDVTTFNEPEFPRGEVRGMGFHEAPRGVLSHWIVIKGGEIENYQCVVPSTWNAGPRDAKGQKGPYEASLMGNPVADAEKPLEVLRTVHSFDPCLACAIHTQDVEGEPIAEVMAVDFTSC